MVATTAAAPTTSSSSTAKYNSTITVTQEINQNHFNETFDRRVSLTVDAELDVSH